MLTMYANLRGVRPDKIKDVVSGTIEHLNLTKWADKLCGDYRRVMSSLFTVPPFANAHTLCASQDGLRNSYFLRTVPTNSKGIFAGAVYEYAGKEDLSKYY